MTSIETATTSKPSRIRRSAKRPTDPNHDANAFLSTRDVHLILRELESYAARIAKLPGREYAARRRHALGLIQKLYAVKWT